MKLNLWKNNRSDVPKQRPASGSPRQRPSGSADVSGFHSDDPRRTPASSGSNGSRPPRPPRPPGTVPPKRRRMNLPFEKKKFDPATWAYEHRIGLCVTVIAYLLIGIIFVSSRIAIAGTSSYHVMYIDLADVQPLEEREMTPEERQQMESELRNLYNQISNENAEEISDRSTNRGAAEEAIDQQSQEIADRLRATRESYEQGRREELEMIDAARTARQQSNEGEQPQAARVEGNVIISYDLEGRAHVYLHKPAYQCEGGGEVVVNITVNRNGDVTRQSVNWVSSTTTSACMTERALHSASISRFNADASAPATQQGTITYRFVPQ